MERVAGGEDKKLDSGLMLTTHPRRTEKGNDFKCHFAIFVKVVLSEKT
jgi:hypothetical protein